MSEIVPLLEKHFGDWKAPATPLPQKNIAAVARPVKPRVFLVDQPGSPQANIIAAQLVSSTADPASLDLDIANGVFGGSFTSRINMNLREEKGWSYGVRSSATGAKGQRPWILSAPVEIGRTGDSIRELIAELEAFTGDRPAEPDELEKIRANRIRSLPGRYETASAVLGTVSGIVSYGWPDDHVMREQERIEGMTLEQVREAAKTLDVNALTWVVVGDLEQIEPQVRALELGEVVVLDADGRPL